MQIATMLPLIRRKLGRPSEAELDDSDILVEIYSVTTRYKSLLKLTQESWIIGRWPMQVPALKTEMNIPLTDFGRAFLVRTVDNTNPNHLPRTVDLVKPEQMSFEYNGPDTLPMPGSSWIPHVARFMCPINDRGTWKMVWRPAHQVSCFYTVWYIPDGDPIPMFDDTSTFPIQDQQLMLVDDIAIQLFPYLADKETGLNARQQGLLQAAQAELAAWQPIFMAAMFEGPRRETKQRRRSFGESRGSGNRSGYGY